MYCKINNGNKNIPCMIPIHSNLHPIPVHFQQFNYMRPQNQYPYPSNQFPRPEFHYYHAPIRTPTFVLVPEGYDAIPNLNSEPLIMNASNDSCAIDIPQLTHEQQIQQLQNEIKELKERIVGLEREIAESRVRQS